jgi:hypothetical protein
MADADGLTIVPTKQQLRRINREFVGAVRSWVPPKFYERRTGQHRALVGAAALRMCDSLDALMVLMTQTLNDESARVVLRSLYEQSIRLSWVLIDPAKHHPLWVGQAQRELLKMHNALASYGTKYLTDAQLAYVKQGDEMPSVEQMTREADAHWPPKVLGLHQSGHELSFHGLYDTVYRMTSSAVHSSLNTLEPYFDFETPWPTTRRSEREEMIVYALGAPVVGIALTVVGQQHSWVDQDAVRRFVDRASAETTRRRERRL